MVHMHIDQKMFALCEFTTDSNVCSCHSISQESQKGQTPTWMGWYRSRQKLYAIQK